MGHGGEEEEHRVALGSMGVTVGDHGGDALRGVLFFQTQRVIPVRVLIDHHNLS